MKATLDILKDIHATQRQITLLTGMSMEEQRERSFWAGVDYLLMITGSDKYAGMIGESDEFKGMWMAIWHYANRGFIDWSQKMIANDSLERWQVMQHWDRFHDISMSNNWIHNPATESCYHNLIKTLAIKR